MSGAKGQDASKGKDLAVLAFLRSHAVQNACPHPVLGRRGPVGNDTIASVKVEENIF